MAILVTFEKIRAAGVQDWRLDNTALKTIRSQGEVPPILHWSGVDLTHSGPYPVLTIRRDKGPAFSMVEPQQPWSWRKTLNRFDDDTLTRIIGPGVTAIFCQPMQIMEQIMAGAKHGGSIRHNYVSSGVIQLRPQAGAYCKSWRCNYVLQTLTVNQRVSPCGIL